MKKLLFILAIIAVPDLIVGQGLYSGFHAGYGTYYMKSFKEYQSMMKDYVSLPNLEKVESFPGYIYYSGSLGVCINSRHSVGVNGAYFTTGARNQVADYSGEYRLDILLNGYRLGVEYQYVFRKEERFEVYGQLKTGVMFSSVWMGMYFELNNTEPERSDVDLRSTTYFGEPSLGARYKIIKDLSACLDLGYQIDTNGKLHEKDDKEVFLMKSNTDYVTINWSGLRVSLGLIYDLNFHKH